MVPLIFDLTYSFIKSYLNVKNAETGSHLGLIMQMLNFSFFFILTFFFESLIKIFVR